MITQKDFLFYTNDFKEHPYLPGTISDPPKAHIICEYSFKNNIDIKKFINNKCTKNEIQNLIKTCFTFNEIITLNNLSKGFYVVGENRLSTLLKGIKGKFNSSICLLEIKGEKILYFSNEYKFISFRPKIPAQSHINNINNFSNNKGFENNSFNNNILNKNFLGNNPFHNNMKLNMNNFNNIESHSTNNNDVLNINNIFDNTPTNNEIIINSSNLETNENKSKIIKSLILLYANEKEILRFYNQGIYDLKKYYLINKTWIDKYKEIYHYNEICKIPLINGINSLNDCSTILTLVNGMNEIKTIYNLINIDTYTLQNISQAVEAKIFGENNEFQYSENFAILNESIFNLLSQISSNIKIKDDYDINFGKLSLCLRNKYDLNKMYFYQYINNSFQISGMIELFADEWKYIYNKHFSKKTFAQYLTEKNINLGLIGQKQSLLSTGNKLLGYIYLINKMGEHNKINENIISNNNVNTYKNENIDISSKLNNIYQNFLQSLGSLPNNMNDFPNIETIMYYLSLNILNGVSVFIVENSTLNYCMNGEKKLMETDIISTDKISESIIYSFINDEICKYFSIQNIEILPKVFLFVNKDRYTKKKLIFIYYQNQNCLLNAINYKQNRFNLKRINGSTAPPRKRNHTLGLENIGATCYMNATLQCLCHVNRLKDYFLDDNKYNQDIALKYNSLSICFAEVIRKLWSQTNETSYAPHNFKNKISEMNPLFQGIQANDSKDLVLFIYENIHRELNEPSQNPNEINFSNIPNELSQFRQNYYSQNYSIISQIFYYEQSSVMECQTCKFRTYNYNIMNIIIFPLEKVRLYMQKNYTSGFSVVTLDDCFNQNEQPELLSGANQIYCNNCRQNANALSYNKLYTCPEVLTIILNRGKGLEFDVNFSFPLTISIDKYVTEKTNDTNYELIGVLTHHGPSGMAGHFVAYCKSPIDNNWYFYNDAVVTPCQGNVESEMQSNGIPYILYYQRRQKGKYCIYFKYGEKEGFFEYNNNNMLLSEAYNKFREKYTEMPVSGRMMLLTETNMVDLYEYKSLKDNGIKNGDKIAVIIE